MNKIALAQVPDVDIGVLAGFKYVPVVKEALNDPKGEEARYLRAQYRAMHHAFLSGRVAAEELLTPEFVVDALELSGGEGPVTEALVETIKVEATKSCAFPPAPYPYGRSEYASVFNQGVSKALEAEAPKIQAMLKAAGKKLTAQDDVPHEHAVKCPMCGASGSCEDVGCQGPTGHDGSVCQNCVSKSGGSIFDETVDRAYLRSEDLEET